MSVRDYAVLADLYAYPTEGYLERIDRVREFLAEHYPAAAEYIDTFRRLLPSEDLEELQELYTRSFDVQAITTLDVGYVLFGEDYKRGELLSNLMREHRLAGNDCGTELGDNLPNLLRLMAKMQDEELVIELVEQILAPALRVMIGEFSPERLAKNDDLYHKHHKTVIEHNSEARTVYQNTLQALREIIHTDFELTETPLLEQTSDFLESLRTEMTIEGESIKARMPGQ